MGGVIFAGILYKLVRPTLALRFFLSHADGENREGKNFLERLHDEMTQSWMLKLFIRVFTDRRGLRDGVHFAPQILRELERTQVGIVLVTPEFFTRKWFMVELGKLLWSHPSVRTLLCEEHNLYTTE